MARIRNNFGARLRQGKLVKQQDGVCVDNQVLIIDRRGIVTTLGDMPMVFDVVLSWKRANVGRRV